MKSILSEQREADEALCRDVRARICGQGEVYVCAHPDIEDVPIDHPDRQCVIDAGRWTDCDMAADQSFASKQDCPFWSKRHRVNPEAPTIEQVSALLGRVEALSEALQEACHERDGLLVPEWQPIETAPRDGTDVLLWATVPPSDLGYIEGPVTVSGYFDSMDDAWCSTLPTVFGPYINPTNWMPLPTPPGEK